MGEVQKVGLVDLVNGKVNLVEALSAAGGLQALNASSRSIYVIRNTSDKRIDVFNLNAKNAMALAMAERFDLNAHDIVYVDASGLATWNRFISLILPSVQTVYYGLLATHNAYVVKNDINK
jgi:polysaccharide export outer membrane protein